MEGNLEDLGSTSLQIFRLAGLSKSMLTADRLARRGLTRKNARSVTRRKPYNTCSLHACSLEKFGSLCYPWLGYNSTLQGQMILLLLIGGAKQGSKWLDNIARVSILWSCR